MIIQKLKFIDYIYESIPHLYNKNIMFIYKKDQNYYLGTTYSQLQMTSPEELVHYLKSNFYNIDFLEHLLQQNILNKCMVAEKTIEQSKEFITDSELSEHKKQWDEFSHELKRLIQKEVQKPKLQLL